MKTLADLCGKTVAVEKGTIEQEEAEAQSKKCTKEGKKAVTVLTFPGQNGANLALSSGRAELGMADSPVAAYQVKQSHGTFKLVGETYGAAPYGFAIPKTTGMTNAGAGGAQGADRQRHLPAASSRSGACRPARSSTPTINGAKS